MTLVVLLFSLFIIATLFLNNKIGLSAYLLFLCVVPLQGLYYGGGILGKNAVLLLVLILGLFKYKRMNRIYNKMLLPFFMLFILQGLLIPFHVSDEPISFQLNMLRIDLMTLILPYIILRAVSSFPKIKVYFRYALYSAIIINVVYGIYLAFNIGQNPYIMELSNISQLNDEGDQSNIINEGLRKFGYISACFTSVTSYGFFLLLSFIYTVRDYYYCSSKKWFYAIILLLIISNILICGSRSVLYTLVAVIGIFLLLNKNMKIFVYSVVVIASALIILYLSFPELYDLFTSFNSDVKGSSIDMRTNQFWGCIEELKKNPLTGNGYKWTAWYLNKNETHPTMIAFESLLIQILCCGGLLGLLFWFIFIYYYHKHIRVFVINKFERIFFYLLIYSFLIRSFLTGDYGGFSLFVIIYSLMLCNVYTSNKI